MILVAEGDSPTGTCLVVTIILCCVVIWSVSGLSYVCSTMINHAHLQSGNHSLVKITYSIEEIILVIFCLLSPLPLSQPPLLAPPLVPSPDSIPAYMQCKTPGCTRPRRQKDDGSGYYDYCGRTCRGLGPQVRLSGIGQLLFTPK